MFNKQNLSPNIRAMVQAYATVTSTMDVAADAARAGAPHLTAIVAHQQTAGRGRHGRVWRTYPGHSLAVTFLLRPPQVTLPNRHLPLLMAMAVRDALVHLVPSLDSSVALKWPNDILLLPPQVPSLTENSQLSAYKLAGLLVETIPSCALFGLGLNLSPPKIEEATLGSFFNDFIPLSQQPISAEMLLEALYPCIQSTLHLYAKHGWAAFHNNYARHCHTLGKTVQWQQSDTQVLKGIALGLHESGALKLLAEDKTMHLIHSGEVSLLAPSSR